MNGKGKGKGGGGFPVRVGTTSGWRTVAKLAVRPSASNGGVAVGLFRSGSHEVVPIPNCRAHHPSVNAAAEAVREACDDLGITAYDEGAGEGMLRYVAANVERRTGRVQLTLVWNSSPPVGGGEKAEAETMLDSLAKRLILEGGGDDDDEDDDNEDDDPSSFALHSLWVHYNASWKHSNAIFDIGDGDGTGGGEVGEGDVKAESPPPNWRLLHGPPHVIETLDLSKSNVPQPNPVRLRFPPNVFRQANLDAFADVVSRTCPLVMNLARGNDNKNQGKGHPFH